MFGESESESPPVPSPWDSLMSISPSPSPSPMPLTPPLVPKLVPEAEEGNIEYKLQLLAPSEARFARLVTQMKWRLLEGGGQAYYELGVADSGALVGLPRAELEQSLETLEMMAGEIGASVIIVKEIEIPAVIAGIAGTDADMWNQRRRRKKGLLIEPDDETTTEDPSDLESFSEWTNPPDAYETSPVIFSFGPLAPDDMPELSLNSDSMVVDLQISEVYKPRPFRTRMASSTACAHDLREKGRKQKKADKSDRQKGAAIPNPPNPHEKARSRKSARGNKMEEKRQALLDYANHSPESSLSTTVLSPVPSLNPVNSSSAAVQANDDLVAGLESLHVSLASEVAPDGDIANVDDTDVFPLPRPFTSGLSAYANSNTSGAGCRVAVRTSPLLSQQPRLIVEALVVRKLSLEEAFLDFGGFSLR